MQYATQTVTVTDRDAKALGQPVGSTTTVLLTAYPGGHSGAATSTGTPIAGGGVAGGGAGGGEQSSNSTTDTASQQFLASQPNSGGNVQVVYSASHVDPVPPSSTNMPPDAVPDAGLAGFTSTPTAPQGSGVVGTKGQVDSGGTTQQQDAESAAAAAAAAVAMGVSDYLNPPPGQLPPHAEGNMGGASGAVDTSSDLAAELIREYSLGGGEGLERKPSHMTTTLPGSTESKDTKSAES